MSNTILIVGNSDGIGLQVTKELIQLGRKVIGISRSETPIDNGQYEHTVLDVRDESYTKVLKSLLEKHDDVGVCIYCAGVGIFLDPMNMDGEVGVIDVNLTSMVKTASVVVPLMVRNRSGHFIGISSVGDELISREAPSYHASKAGFTSYLEGLAMALRQNDVFVTNIRLGFVDTKMAQASVKPFMMSTERAAKIILKCIEKKPIRKTAPLLIVPIIRLINLITRIKIAFRS